MVTEGSPIIVRQIRGAANGFAVWVTKHQLGRATPDQNDRFGIYFSHRDSDTKPVVAAPISSGGVVLVHTGRVDNRTEVARLLGQPALATAPDGEVLLAAYLAWAEQFAGKVSGEFSVAIVDTNRSVLIGVRDALGIHKLLYSDQGDRLWITSSLDLLLDVLPSKPARDLDGLCYFLAGGALLDSSGHTVHKSISHVGPAHLLRCAAGDAAPVLERYWAPDLDRTVEFADEREYDEEFRRLLFDAVRASIRDGNATCLELSGGLDSSTVASVALTLRDRTEVRPDLAAFTLTGSKTFHSQEPHYWRAVVERYQVEHHSCDIDSIPDRLDLTNGQPRFADGQPWIVGAQEQLAARRGLKVCLSGHGGDAVFGLCMPPFYLAESLRSVRLRHWWREVGAWLQGDKYSLWKLLTVFSFGDVLNAFGKPPSLPSWLHRDIRDRIAAAQHRVYTGHQGRFVANHRVFHYHVISMVAANLPDQQYAPWELRCPLLARPLVEFMLAMPHHQKTTPGANRVLQRRALQGILPENVRTRQSKGDFTPRFFRGLRESWAEWEPFTHGTHLGRLGLVDPDRFHAACQRLRVGQPDDDLSFFVPALLLEGWLTSHAGTS